MALPAGMGLSAAAAAAGYSYLSPNPTPEPADSALAAHVTDAEDPEEMLLGGLAALSEPEPSTQAPGNGVLDGSAEGRCGPRESDGDTSGDGVDPTRVQLRQQQQQQQQPQQPQQQQQQQQRPMMPPVVPPRIHQVTSPPPPHPPASMLAVLGELRSSGEIAVLPGRGVGLQAVLCAKRGQRALRASAALSEEVKKRFPTQAAQAARLTAAEEKLDKKISAVRRRLYSKMEGVEWTSKFLRAWLSLEVISTPNPQQQQQQKRQDEAADAAKRGAGWFVMARVQGTVIDAPADGVERRFTSFFSKVALKLDSKAFPEVAAVEWVRSRDCEELHCVELKLPLERTLALGVKAVNVKVSLHPRLDNGRPRRFTLSPRLRRALCLSDRVETKPVLVAAVCEALRHRGLLPPRGEARGGRGGTSGVPMVACDPPLEDILGTSAFPFSQLEEALGPHVEPAGPPVLDATIALEGGSTREAMLDVRVDTEAPFQLQAVKALLGGGEKQPSGAVSAGKKSSSSGQEEQGKKGLGLGVMAVREREEEMQLDRQISYLMEAVNSSGRRAAMLRALSENPIEVVPKLEAQILADEEMLAAAAGIERPAREEEVEPWLDLDVCGEVIEARAEQRKKEQVRREIEGQRKERAAQHVRAEAALLQAAREQRKKQREARAAAQAAAAAATKQASEREQKQQQQRQRLREAQELAVLEERERKRRKEKQKKEQQQHQRMQQAVMLAQRQAQQAQAQQAQGVRARAAAEAARKQEAQGQREAQNIVSAVAATAVPGAAAGGSGNSSVTAATSSPSNAFARLRAMQLQQQASAAQGHRLGQQQQRRISLPQCTSGASPRERVSSPISPIDNVAQQQQQQLQGLRLAQASHMGFPGQQKPQQSLSLPSLGPGMGPELQERFQQQRQQEAASTMDAEERKRQELLEQTLLSQNDDLDPPQPPAPSPRRQDQQQQYQWPGSTAASPFKSPDVAERGCYRQAPPMGLGGQQQQLQQMNPPRVGSAGSPQDNNNRQQQMEEAWRRRRRQMEQQRQQQQGIAAGSVVHGSCFQDQVAVGQSPQEAHYSSSSSSSSSPSPSVPTTSSAAAGASAGPVQDAFRGGLVVGRPRSEPRVEDQRRYRQRQYQQLAQLAHIQQQQQRQGLVQGLVQGGHGGSSHAAAVSAASGVFRSPTQRGTGAILQQQQQQQQVEWARRSVPAQGQSHAGVVSSELSSTPQSLGVVDGGGGQSVGTPMEPGLGGGRMEEHSQQQHQPQPQSAVSSYSGWQSVEERRRSENSNRKR